MAEEQKHLAADEISVIYDKKLFKLFLPVEFGGLKMSLPEAVSVFEECSKVDGSFGWLVTIGAGGNYFFDYLGEDAGTEFFSLPEAVVAGSGAATGTATKTNGAYKVRGRWRYCSGANYATLFTVNCRVMDENGNLTDIIRSFALKPDQVKIIEDWDAMGMKATESHSIVVEDTLVPAEKSFSIFEPKAGENFTLIYSYPFMAFARVSFAAVIIGLGDALLKEAFHIVENSKDQWQNFYPNRFSRTKEQIIDCNNRMEAAKTAFHQKVEESWQQFMVHGSLSQDFASEVNKSCLDTAESVIVAGHDIFPYLGMQVLMATNRINRIWRDIHTAYQHILLRDFD